MKFQNDLLNQLLKDAPESGPVYAKASDAPVETVSVNQDVVVQTGTYGPFLNVTIEGIGTRPVSIRDVKPDTKLTNTQFRLEVWSAVRDLPASGNRKAIVKGQKKVFAVAI